VKFFHHSEPTNLALEFDGNFKVIPTFYGKFQRSFFLQISYALPSPTAVPASGTYILHHK
jgi:hypothetical protein